MTTKRDYYVLESDALMLIMLMVLSINFMQKYSLYTVRPMIDD